MLNICKLKNYKKRLISYIIIVIIKKKYLKYTIYRLCFFEKKKIAMKSFTYIHYIICYKHIYIIDISIFFFFYYTILDVHMLSYKRYKHTAAKLGNEIIT